MPIGSMYGIYGNLYHQYTPNVSIYTIHGSFGIYIYIQSIYTYIFTLYMYTSPSYPKHRHPQVTPRRLTVDDHGRFRGPDGRVQIFHGLNVVQKSFPWHPSTGRHGPTVPPRKATESHGLSHAMVCQGDMNLNVVKQNPCFFYADTKIVICLFLDLYMFLVSGFETYSEM